MGRFLPMPAADEKVHAVKPEHSALRLDAACRADRTFDAKDSLLRGRVLVTAVAFFASHITDNSGDRPEVVREFFGLLRAHAQDCLTAAAAFYQRRVVQRFFGKFAEGSLSGDPVGRIPYVSSGYSDEVHLLRSVITWGGVREVIGDDLYERALLALDKIGEKP